MVIFTVLTALVSLGIAAVGLVLQFRADRRAQRQRPAQITMRISINNYFVIFGDSTHAKCFPRVVTHSPETANLYTELAAYRQRGEGVHPALKPRRVKSQPPHKTKTPGAN